MQTFLRSLFISLWKTLPMIKTEFCFPQLNAENRYLFPSHCLHIQDIKEASRAYQFRRGRKQDRKIGKKNIAESQPE